MSASLPLRPSLDNLKNQAKTLLKSFKSKDPNVCQILRNIRRFAALSDAEILAADVSLADMQFALAIEYGFAGWTELKAILSAAQESAPSNEAADAPNILWDMRPCNGKWEEAQGDRMAIFFDGPSTTMVSQQTWPGDAIIVEVLARAEVESKWGLHFQVQINPYPGEAAHHAANATEPVFPIRCGRREKYIWSDIIFNNLNASWSRDINYWSRMGSFNGVANKWYTLKAERIGQMLRLWVDGVPVSEMRDERPVPRDVYVWIQSVCSDVRFRSVKVYRPSDAYIRKYSHPIKIFDPYALRSEILSHYPDTIVRQASIELGPTNREDGLTELVDPKYPTIAEADRRGKSCRRIAPAAGYHTMDFKLGQPAGWNWNNEIRLEIDSLDDGAGALTAFYRTWHYHDTPLPDQWRQRRGGQWRTCTYTLREPFIREGAEGPDFRIACVHSPDKSLPVHAVRLIETSKPREAYEAVLHAMDEQIEAAAGNWSTVHYLFHKAMILRYNLDQPQQAEQIMQEIHNRFGDSECLAIDALMRNNR